jgi:hypothetical protein
MSRGKGKGKKGWGKENGRREWVKEWAEGRERNS